MESFFDGCVAAGPDACAFYAPTAEQISNNLDSLYDSLLTQPVPVVSSSFYGFVDYSVLRSLIWGTLYAPYIYFSTLAEGLASLTNRQRRDSLAAFSLFFPDVAPEELPKQRIMIKDIVRVAKLLKEKINADDVPFPRFWGIDINHSLSDH